MSMAINLPDSLYAQLSGIAAKAGVDREDLASEILAKGLAERSADAPESPPREVRPLPPVFASMGPMLIAPTNAAINELLEAEDLENYFRVLRQNDRSSER